MPNDAAWRDSRVLVRYGLALAAVAGTTAIKVLLDPLIEVESPFLLYFASVLVTTWVAGLGPGIFATLLAGLVADYLFLTPIHHLFGHGPGQNLRLGLFAIEGVTISFIAEKARQAVRRERDIARCSEALRREAEALNENKDQLLAMISHELREPLQAALGWMTLIQSGTLDRERAAQGLEIIERNIVIENKLIEELLDTSGLLLDQVKLEPQPVDPVAVVDLVVESLTPVAAAKDVRLDRVIQWPGDGVQADPHRLRQILTNLVSNALKATPPGGRVEVRLGRVELQTQLVVSDTGEGIPAELLPRIFDRFVQGEHREGRKGLGLGLYIVQRLVALHGGTVEAQSAGRGQGATFVVSLPLAPPDRGR